MRSLTSPLFASAGKVSMCAVLNRQHSRDPTDCLAMRRTKTRLCCTLLLALAAFPASFTAQKKDKGKENDEAATLPEMIWRDPGDTASLNLFYGAGGEGHAPDPNGPFTFVKEDLQETSPKFDVKDDQGVEWRG